MKQKKFIRDQKYLMISLVIIAVLITAIIATSLKDNNKINKTIDFASLGSEVFPSEGFKTKIILGDVIPKLVQSGAIDLEKFKGVYGELNDEQLKLLIEPSYEQLTITPENANFLLSILWPLGISNKNPILEEVAKYDGVENLASTGGWTLGKENAMVYFNKLELVELTPEQQAILEEVAANAYRPCCNNPTSFPDCNHGVALLALLELGASQGLSEEELYTLALQANTFWFPQQYLSTATYLKTQNIDYWSSAKEIVGFEYSSATGWTNNVYKPLQKQELLPKTNDGASCGV